MYIIYCSTLTYKRSGNGILDINKAEDHMYKHTVDPDQPYRT
jgi:hypothetical protein